jgi:catechol 2,3-dioxygenase-like lactoylglutathione lyase family enzyme
MLQGRFGVHYEFKFNIKNHRTMKNKNISIRPFIGAKNYALSRSFYTALGFEELVLSSDMSLFKTALLGFYLQNAYVKDWVDNTMVFLEVDDADQYYKDLLTLDLSTKYEGVRLSPVRELDWGKECFVHDPSGILWHIGQFNKH